MALIFQKVSKSHSMVELQNSGWIQFFFDVDLKKKVSHSKEDRKIITFVNIG
jgi:hypothetical protein